MTGSKQAKDERRLYPRYKAPDVIAVARVPDSPLDFYFHVADLSQNGMALVTWSTEGFPLSPDAVVDIEVFSHLGSIQCRGVVARLIPAKENGPTGFGMRVYGFGESDLQKWLELLESQKQWGTV